MIGIVKLALTRPLTFIVMAVLILIGGVYGAMRMPVDVFPNIGVPVIAASFTYSGLSPSEMAGRIMTPYERVITTTVDNIEHIETQSLPGIGVAKIYFQPGADISIANAQVTSVSQSVLKQMPPGITPPLVLDYNASTVPILQLAISGKGLSEQKLADVALNQIRPQLITVSGAALPYPFGGKSRQVQVDLDSQAMQAAGLSAPDIGRAIAAQNQINPVGFAKMGSFQYNVKLNNAPRSIEALNDIPVKVVNGATILLRDVAHVRDGAPPQTNIVHVDGQRSVLMTVLKNGKASTLSIINEIKSRLPAIETTLPAAMTIRPVGDQAVFVKAAVSGVVREGVIAALLTSLMILLFLGSWRSTVIIAISIPLAVLAALAALAAFGQTLNVMTLGGLALAVGILVDDATVTIENINWHLEQGKPVTQAILDGAAQIVTPAFVSLLCICIVFVPMFFLPGVAGFLFVPMALSVVFAMIASFILSRTLVPTMAMYLLKRHRPDEAIHAAGSTNPLVRIQRGFEMRFGQLRALHASLLGRALGSRRRFVIGFMAVVLASFLLTPFLGRNFFPSVDAGQIAIHVRGPIGSRVEDSSARFQRIGRRIRQLIPADELTTIADNIGMPVSGINTTYNNTGTIGPQDGDIMITLAAGHRPTERYVAALRRSLPRDFPGTSFAFLPADITSQILNFGSPAPIDLQVTGYKGSDDMIHAQRLLRDIRAIPGVADARIQQSSNYPQLDLDVDRARIGQLGLTEQDVTNSVASSLAGTGQTAPVYFLNPETGISYLVAAQTPEYHVGSLSDLGNIPVSGPGASANDRPQILGGLATVSRSRAPSVVSHYSIQTVIDIFASPEGRDLGAIGSAIRDVVKRHEAQQPKGVTVNLRGQYATMNTAFSGLGIGLVLAILFIYLVIVVNFQSWTDPFVIVTALPAALAGIVWMLFASGTTLSVPALTGAIMCMGVATANSILVVSFARERLAETGDPIQAAFEAGQVRFRPVLMTALAMIIGMLPMALGTGEGGEQNAPLGRAVIGGLIFATIATLMFVPVIFSIAHRRTAERAHRPIGELVNV